MIPANQHSSSTYLFRRLERWIFCSALSMASIAFAQVGTASLSGTITDATGAVVPNASVILHSTQGAFTRTVRSGSDGLYVLSSLQPGSYELSIQAAGFQDQKSGRVELSSGQAATLNVTLTVAGASAQDRGSRCAGDSEHLGQLGHDSEFSANNQPSDPRRQFSQRPGRGARDRSGGGARHNV